MKRNRIAAMLTSAALAAAMLTACGAKPGSAVTSTGTGVPEEKIRVVYWHTYTDQHEEALADIIRGFNASQERYEVVAEQQPYSEIDGKLLQAARNGTGPDLVNMFPSDAVNYKNDGLLVDLAPYINAPETGIPDFQDNIPAGTYAELTQWGGERIYFFPTTIVGEVLFYGGEIRLSPLHGGQRRGGGAAVYSRDAGTGGGDCRGPHPFPLLR